MYIHYFNDIICLDGIKRITLDESTYQITLHFEDKTETLSFESRQEAYLLFSKIPEYLNTSKTISAVSLIWRRFQDNGTPTMELKIY